MKKLTPPEQHFLTLAIVQGGYRIDSAILPTIANLVVGGYLLGDELTAASLPIVVIATSKGVRAAVRLGIVIQDGTRFRLPEGSNLVLQTPLAVVTSPLTFANVHAFPPPPKPRDPFDEGFTAARAGQPANNTWTDLNDASMYDEGFKQGDLWRQQNPVVSA